MRFALRLAMKLGKSLKWVNEQIDPDEFLIWQAFYKLEPWGCAIDDYRAGKVLESLKGGSALDHFPGYHPDDGVTARQRACAQYEYEQAQIEKKRRHNELGGKLFRNEVWE